MEENNTYDVYYDEDGDFLEISFGIPPENEGTEQVEPGIFITRNTETNQVSAMGILGFKKRCHVLNEVLKRLNIDFPLNITCS